MRRVLSTRMFAVDRLTTALLDRIYHSGFRELELLCAGQHFNYRHRGQVDELRHWFRDADMRPVAVQAPIFYEDATSYSNPDAVIDITTLEKPRRIKATDEIKRALEIADRIPVQYCIVRLGLPDTRYDDARMDAGFNALDELHVFARQLEVEILLENIDNGLSSAERLGLFLRTTHLPLGYCFNTGSAALQSAGVESEFESMRERIRAVHLHDRGGDSAIHRMPLISDGHADWSQTMDLLRGLPADTPFIIDVDPDPGVAAPLERARETFDRLEEL